MSYLEDFLDDYYEHIEEYAALLLILSLLPDSYIYIFVKNLLKYSHFLCDGDVYKGIKSEGIIRIVDNTVMLEKQNYSVVLLDLPEPYDI